MAAKKPSSTAGTGSVSKLEYLRRQYAAPASSASASSAHPASTARKSGPPRGAAMAVVDDDIDLGSLAPKRAGAALVAAAFGDDVGDDAPEIIMADEEVDEVEATALAAARAAEAQARGGGWTAVPTHAARAAAVDASPPRRHRRHDSSDDEGERNGVGRVAAAAAAAAQHARLSAAARNGTGAASAAAEADASPPRRRRRLDSDDEVNGLQPKGGNRVASLQAATGETADGRSTVKQARAAADASPPRRRRHASDASPSADRPGDRAAVMEARGPTDRSPSPRRSRQSPRRSRSSSRTRSVGSDEQVGTKRHRRRRRFDSDDEANPPLMASGARSSAGVAVPAAVSLSGRHAATVYRDSTGRKVDVAAELAKHQAAAAGKAATSAIESYEWGTGTVQKQQARDEAAELAKMAAAPFARYAGDAELEAELKARIRADDPMAMYASRSKPAATSGSNGDASGRKPAYSGPPGPPNRYNIRPGYRWDGVDRGNNWEAKVLLHRNRAAVQKEKQYLNAVADM